MTPDARLLKALHQGTPLLPSELAEAAGLPLASLATHLDGMSAAGYAIEHSPHSGYRLLGTPDRLIADDIAARLSAFDQSAPRRIGREIVVFAETASTNDIATRLGRSGTTEGVAIFAERQTSGRGRLGRKWESAAHQGLWFSILLRPHTIGLAQQHWAQLTTWAAVGVAQALEEIGHASNLRAGIKWPNDILIQNRKAVGILIESGIDPAGDGYAVAGIGVNINQLDFPPELATKATSLRLAQHDGAAEQPPPLDRMAVAARLLHRLDLLYKTMAATGFSPILAEAERRSVLTGEWIDVQTPSGRLQGIAEGLNPDGSLRLRCSDGREEHLFGGEVSIAKWY